ncbi:WecB/TagA/CpsF family glycosyltransferase [Tsukamurella ocularis]|uniref:WecB/TagA/CpsF family glycosyltransferase n=1 Tax=Tsukamurella ocularis TaxID=1970234 RepID=UPI0021683074|nr:WecB/TagA/CpsF family glycosyltransferase [Tsukamurella ocularis]MCS3779447.1 exopolysaccharide biosynthesis WecB/TagA/CpsF family protein [Tsukamurella ocularis]MCS3788079.1 exopolysaccharide biosynthesis WecB/TagA/CpsF family protein [Tsukamurella ocularis]MCS3852395.1 exopolysaccharide biosynthesis WecB/TagA/CpsF family protein [Tsukamurella ocularis]
MSTRTAMVVDDQQVVCATDADVLSRIGLRIAMGGSRPLAICSANVDHFHHFGRGRRRLGRDVDWLSVADGAPVARRGAALARHSWPRVTGADLLPSVIAMAEERCWSIGFVGGTPAMHDRLAGVLAERYPALDVAGYWAPERTELDDPAASALLVNEIREARPTVLIVGLGKPRQEQWIDEAGPGTGAEVLLPFGAAADFMAGMVVRAPAVWQRAGAEWLYRLWQEPRRLGRRYLVQGPRALLRLRRASLELVTWPEPSRPGGAP